VILVIAYLAYRQSQPSSLAQVPANGYGYPDYGSATGGGGGGSTSSLGYTPYQTSDPTAPSNYTVSPSGVTTVASATPALPSYTPSYTPSYPAFSLSPFTFAPTASSPTPVRTMVDVAAPVTTLAGIQNPTAAQDIAHRGLTVAAPVTTLAGIQNPTAAQDIAHRGLTVAAPPEPMHPAASMPAPVYTVPHINTTFIPTTIRPQTVTTRGRVA
jgi:hypothetical protein